MSDYKIPELPSDEELGIAGLSEEDFKEPPAGGKGPSGPSGGPPPSPPSRTKAGKGNSGHRPLPWRGWITLGVLVAGVWLSSSYRSLPDPRTASAPDTVFSSGRALTLLVEMSRRPHPPGSPEHDRVRDLLVDRLRELGLEPEIQEATQIVARRERARAATVRNVVARIPGTASTGALLLTAHYDAVPGSPGAGDDATGVSVILETLRALGAGEPLQNDVIVLLSDAEELGLLGARAFVERHPWIGDVQVVLSVEMRGAGGPSVMFETGAENGWIVERLQEVDPLPVANSLSTEIYRRLPNDTDFSSFRDAGIQGLNFAAIGRADRYHQATDTPEHLQEATLQHHGERMLAMVRHLGRADLGEVRGRDRAFVVLPFVGMLTIPVGLTLPITLGLLVGLLVVTFLASLRGTRSRGFLLAAILSAVAVGLSAGAGWALLRWVLPRLPVYGTGALVPAVHGEGIFLVALAVLALGITGAVFSLGHRWMTPLEATLGALLLPVLALLAATLMAPAAAINLQGPLAATLLLLALLTGVGLHRAKGTVAWIASLVLALPVLAFLVPVMELVGVALTLRAAPLMGGLMAFALLFILPALSALDYPNRWWAPLTALLVSGAALGVGWLRAGPTPERPAPATLLYAMERGSDGTPATARWVSREGPGLDWAKETAGTPLTDSTSLEAFGIPDRGYVGGEAPFAEVAPPEVRVLRDTVVSGNRVLRIGVRSMMGAELLRITLPDGVEVVGMAGAGTLETEPFSPAVRILEHWGRPAQRLELELSGDPGIPWTVDVVEHLLRPGEIFGPDRFRRPPELMPDLRAFGDRAVFLTPVALTPTPEPGTGELPEGEMAPGEAQAPGAPAPDSSALPDTSGAATDTTRTGGTH